MPGDRAMRIFVLIMAVLETCPGVSDRNPMGPPVVVLGSAQEGKFFRQNYPQGNG